MPLSPTSQRRIPNSREPKGPPASAGMPSIPSWSPCPCPTVSPPRSALPAPPPALFVQHLFFYYSLLIRLYSPNFPCHLKLHYPLSTNTAQGAEDCFKPKKKKNPEIKRRARGAAILPDDCTAERHACACSYPRTKSPSQEAPSSAFPRAATQKRRRSRGAEPPSSRARSAGSCGASLGCTPAPRRPLCAEQMPPDLLLYTFSFSFGLDNAVSLTQNVSES